MRKHTKLKLHEGVPHPKQNVSVVSYSIRLVSPAYQKFGGKEVQSHGDLPGSVSLNTFRKIYNNKNKADLVL